MSVARVAPAPALWRIRILAGAALTASLVVVVGVATVAAAGPSVWFVAGVCAFALALLVLAALRGFEGFGIALVVASMLPLPTVTLLGTAQFPFASFAVVALLVSAWWVARVRGLTPSAPCVMPYLVLIGVAAVSLAASWLFWDARVPTGAERGYGHRSIVYQLTGLYLLAFPLVAFAAGAFSSRLIRVDRLLAWVCVALTGLTVYALSGWIQHPGNPIDLFNTGDRVKFDYQWAAFLAVASSALLLNARSRRLRIIAVALLALAAFTVSVEYVLSAWLGVAIGIAFVVWLRFGWRGVVLMAAAITAAALVVEPTVSAIVSQRASSTDVDRLKIWQSALIVWSKSPLIGVGPANLASYMETYSLFPLGLVLQGYQQAHNIFLEILAEEGVAGIALLVAFVWLILRSLVRWHPESTPDAVARAGAGGVLITAAVIASLGGGFIPTIASAGYNALPYV
ncbi:MAG: O-antigen ligase family protein, partial [Candidatus Dormibacteraeota bacterium]|nr:O-antigen ligase family protein [Candidatus Dormibacteraeota bacterium]